MRHMNEIIQLIFAFILGIGSIIGILGYIIVCIWNMKEHRNYYKWLKNQNDQH